MMKYLLKWKRMICIVLCAGMILSPEYVQAASQQEIPKSIHTNYDAVYLTVPMKTIKHRIKNLKTDSLDAKANVCTIAAEEGLDLYSEIGIDMRKEGTYKVTFDVYNGSGKKESSHSVKVYYDSEQAVNRFEFDGKKCDEYGSLFTKKTKGKLSVEMNKDYKLKKIVISTYDKTGKENAKQIKNNETITLGRYSSIYKYGKETGSEYTMYRSVLAGTTITVYYIDKYTGQEEQKSFSINRPAA